ncbi:MAG: TPM domain-containing protein [Bacteroidia bacterium]
MSKQEEELVVDAIKAAETGTSGEIRVHIANSLNKDVLSDAKVTFNHLKMNKTELKNGVLIYLVPKQKQFAIIGDEGIDNVLKPGFWEDSKDKMQEFFKQGKFVEGIISGIQSVAETLKTQFPYQSDDVNELDDEISYDA